MTVFPVPLRRRQVLVDSSANLALLDRGDGHHRAAIAIMDSLIQQRYRQYTTNAMLIESHALVMSVLGIRIANQFVREATGGRLTIVRVRASDEERAREILYRYEDKSFSYNDAISFAIMERLGIDLAFTFDSDFRQYGWSVVAPPP